MGRSNEIRLLNGHNGTKQTAIIAVEASHLESAAVLWHSASFRTMDPPKEGSKLLRKITGFSFDHESKLLFQKLLFT